VRLFILARHGQSLFNVDGVVNCDPRRDKGLSERGIGEARDLGHRISAIDVDVVVVSAFPRAAQTADLALEGRALPRVIDEDLGDIHIGELDGSTLAEYRASEAHSQRDLRFPGGESLNDAARRYATALTRLLGRDERVTLVVAHEIVVRYALNGAAASDSLDQPFHDIDNATPYLFDQHSLHRAVTRIGELAARL
jgi:probable phosphoglycerate mutase